jgi:hypothetical protein
MSRTLKEFYPALVALALALSLLFDGALFIMTMAAAIAALPLAYAQDADEIARQVRSQAQADAAGNAPGDGRPPQG